MKFYFAGAIRGGRERQNIYIKINEVLEKYGEVLDKHVANPNVMEMEKNKTLEEIYNTDINWIKECDILIAEVSIPSLGVGYEISYAENLRKRIICLIDDSINISAMIGGNKYFELIKYKNSDDLLSKLDDKFKKVK